MIMDKHDDDDDDDDDLFGTKIMGTVCVVRQKREGHEQKERITRTVENE